jgi:hypothetical protein
MNEYLEQKKKMYGVWMPVKRNFYVKQKEQ